MKKSILSKLFNKKNNKEIEEYSKRIGRGNIVYQNDHTILVHDSCRICYNKPMKKSFDERCKYISDKIKLGHDSILEHSNVIMRLELEKDLYSELCEVLTLSKYINSKIKETDNSIEVLLGGSIRGYRHIIRFIKNPNNRVYNIIKNSLYDLPSCYFVDMIEDNIMNEKLFSNFDIKVENKLDSDGNIINSRRYEGIRIEREKYDIVGIDDVMEVYSKVNNNIKEEYFSIDDIMDIVTISILFKGISRTASHQLVRHRAGITQLSQRYVNMKDSKFLSPDEFKPEKYNPNDKYNITINGVTKQYTLQEIGKLELGIYEQLLEQNLLKEDARSFLPNNIETSLYMTFTFRGFIKFLELRTGKGAQEEIKQLAKALKEDFESTQYTSIGNDIYSYLRENYNRIPMDLDKLGQERVDEILEEEIIK